MPAAEAPEPDLLLLAAEEGRLPPLIGELVDLAAAELAAGDAPYEPYQARRTAMRIVARLCREHGGTSPYLPKGNAMDRALRVAAIWADYDGTVTGPCGIRALAMREGLSEVHVYRVLDAQRERRRTGLPKS